MEDIGKPNQRKLDFYERNMGESVNFLTKEGTTYSGDLTFYDKEKRIVGLKNYIWREYNENGTSEIRECNREIEINVQLIHVKQIATKEDRLGRIVKYNWDLMLEDSEKSNRLKQLQSED